QHLPRPEATSGTLTRIDDAGKSGRFRRNLHSASRGVPLRLLLVTHAKRLFILQANFVTSHASSARLCRAFVFCVQRAAPINTKPPAEPGAVGVLVNYAEP